MVGGGNNPDGEIKYLFSFFLGLCVLPPLFGLTDPPAPPHPHHELPSPAPVRQQLRGQPPQRLHDGSAEASPFRHLHLLPRLPRHRAAAAPERPHPEPEFWFWFGQLPQLLLQRGKERAGGSERGRSRTR